MKSVAAKAHAKLIVLGEHFVVPWKDDRGKSHPGSSALAIPLPGLETEVRIAPSKTLVLEPPTGDLLGEFSGQSGELMEKAVRAAADLFGWDLEANPLRVSSSSNFPVSRGLGSSAAFSVSLSRAFQALCPESRIDLFVVAQTIENLFHGKSSGLDTSVILKDQPIVFRDGGIQDTFDPIAVDWVVVDSGPRDECASLVQQTLAMRKSEPERWTALAETVNDLARRCISALENANGAAEVAETIRESGKILEGIGLVTPNVARVLELGQKCGAIAGKVSGAGAGGAVLFVTQPGQGQALARRIRETGIPVLAQIAPLRREQLHA